MHLRTKKAGGMRADTLGETGEFRLLTEVVLPKLRKVEVREGLGDDAASAAWPDSHHDIVVTVDRATKPLVFALGIRDLRILGWYAVHVSASDLAAAGATPLLFASSVEAPSSTSVVEFEHFFDGVADACEAFGMRNAGGNINQGERFTCHGTAVGTVEAGKKIRRSGCPPEAFIVSIGECGLFAAAYLQALRRGLEGLDPLLYERLIRPQPRVREMLALAKDGLIVAASDCSDGLVGTLWNISEASNCQIIVEIDESKIPDVVRDEARMANLDPWNLMFFWGDWQIVVAVLKERWTQFQTLALNEGIPYVILGHSEAGNAALFADCKGKRTRLRLLRNEGFSAIDYDTADAQNINFLLTSDYFRETIR